MPAVTTQRLANRVDYLRERHQQNTEREDSSATMDRCCVPKANQRGAFALRHIPLMQVDNCSVQRGALFLG